MIFADQDLARRLESFEARFSAECSLARRRSRPEADTVTLAVAGGFALFQGRDSPLSEAKGMGMAGPVSREELEALGRVFHDRGVPAKVMVCPLADPSLVGGLADLGYRAAGFEDVLYRELGPGLAFPGAPDGVAIRPIGPGEVEAFGLMIGRGFFAPEEPGPDILDVFASMADTPGMTSLVAEVDGEPAGGASVVIRDGLALLAGASTLPSYRNRGIQTALAHARLALASASGCSLATMGAEPGSTSHRNAERLGFRVAYTKLVLVLDPP